MKNDAIPQSMQALLLTDDGPIVRNDYPTPAPQPGEALIHVSLAGICSTDLQLMAGYKGGYRGVLGHEFVGTVVSAPGDESWIGRRVVGEINIGCGQCSLCRRGQHKHCRQRQSMGIIGRDGAFADYLTLPLANLHAVPEAVSDEQAVFVEPLAAAFQILEQVHLTPDSRVCLLGVGRLGLLVAQVLASTNCDLTVLVRNRNKETLLAELGIPVGSARFSRGGRAPACAAPTSWSTRPDRRRDSTPRASLCVQAGPSCSRAPLPVACLNLT